jgi:hypothetical protein
MTTRIVRVAVVDIFYPGVWVVKGRMFFFAKKNQKTFASAVAAFSCERMTAD